MLPTKNPLIRTRGFFLCTVSHVVASCISITPVSDVVSPLATCDSSLLASQRFRLRPIVAVDVFALSAMARTVIPVPSSGQMILSISRSPLLLVCCLREAASVIERTFEGAGIDQLEEALTWKERSLLSQDEEDFLHASTVEKNAQQVIALKGEQRERRLKRRSVLVGLTVGFVGLGVAGTALTLSIVFRPKSSSPPFSLPYTLLGHTDGVNSVAWSPDSKLLASASAGFGKC